MNVRQKEHKRHLTNGHTEDSGVAAHAHQHLHDIDWENALHVALDHEDDYFKRKVREALRIKQRDNFNQDSGLAISPIWSALL